MNRPFSPLQQPCCRGISILPCSSLMRNTVLCHSQVECWEQRLDLWCRCPGWGSGRGTVTRVRKGRAEALCGRSCALLSWKHGKKPPWFLSLLCAGLKGTKRPGMLSPPGASQEPLVGGHQPLGLTQLLLLPFCPSVHPWVSAFPISDSSTRLCSLLDPGCLLCSLRNE